jgi:hypothetical protein
MARDHLRAEITRQLVPLLKSAGFQRAQPKHFLSVSGDLVRHVGFQLSQWGGQSFYVHLYVNTVLNPLGSLHGYRVGRRLQAGNDGNPWQASTEASAREAVSSVASTLSGGQLSWLEGVRTLRDFVYEYVSNPQTTADDFDLALVLARAGETNRPWWSAERLCQPKPQPDEGEYQQELRARARVFQAAIKSGTTPSLLSSWREEYIAANKLGEYAS